MLKHNKYENMNLYQTLKTFSHYQQVSFAFYCTKEVEFLANDQRVIDCNNTIERWLNGDKSVDLIIARNNAWNAWSDAYSAAVYYVAAVSSVVTDTAWHAFYAATNATSAASAASAAASSAAYSADTSAWHAAHAKSYNLYPNNNEQREIARNQFFNEYKQIAQNWLSHWNIPNFPKDSDFPIFDFLQDYNIISCLLPKKDNFYYLNLNGFNIKHENEIELLKLIDTIHIKNIIRRIIKNAEAS